MIFAIISFIVPLVIGFLTVAFFTRKYLPRGKSFLLNLSLGTGVGFGLVSILFFFWKLAGGVSHSVYFVLEVSLLAVLAIAFFFFYKKTENCSTIPSVQKESTTWLTKFLKITLGLTILFSVCSVVTLLIRYPWGGWDAVSQWNNYGKFMGLGGDNWLGFLSEEMRSGGHKDYPMLLPSVLGRSFAFAGGASAIVPGMVTVLTIFAVAAILFSSLAIIKGKREACLALFILLGTRVVTSGRWSVQYADIQLAFFILAALILISLYSSAQKKPLSFIALAGVMAGFGAWTKNEGLLFLAVLVLVRLVIMLVRKDFKKLLQEVICFSAGFGLILILVLWYKANLATEGAKLFMDKGSFLDKLTDGERYIVVAKRFFAEMINIKRWPMFALLFLYLIFAGIDKKQFSKGVGTVFFTLLTMFVGYFFVFIVTPRDLPWHLDTLIDRMFLHLFPSLVFLVFLVSGKSAMVESE